MTTEPKRLSAEKLQDFEVTKCKGDNHTASNCDCITLELFNHIAALEVEIADKSKWIQRLIPKAKERDEIRDELRSENQKLKAERDHWEMACGGRRLEHDKHLSDKLELKDEIRRLTNKNARLLESVCDFANERDRALGALKVIHETSGETLAAYDQSKADQG